VHHSFGDFPGGEYAMQLVADHPVPAWDLARAGLPFCTWRWTGGLGQ
jgi:hypothetical protein